MSFSILGTGRAVPEHIVSNDDLSMMVETNDEWIRTRTGIHNRRVITTETMTELCVTAANQALDNAGITAKDLDLIICATMKGMYITPSEACVIQKEIGASCPAFDLNAACSGFIYSLDVADGFFARGKVKHALIVAFDNLSNMVDWTDRSTCVLFGDGGGAVVLGEGDGLKSIHLTANGNTDVLFAPRGELISPFDTHKGDKPVLHMAGQDVYKFAVTNMIRGIRKVIKDAGLEQTEINYMIPHQANIRIIDAAASKLDIPRENFVVNVGEYGNTSAGSIPICLDEINKQGKLKKGDYIVMCAFGAGLTTGSCVIQWDK
ncbi:MULTISPECIES: beta-ketoacyl-ACP synthase III [unclassified Ruminococcus]|uniref:beta-ketoacyl-ACP synthase III n=1 Tax=unclassified Ruminococcus TaxID=2608920 RepID=UPI00210E060C|nr:MULTISPECIES: beta-ketoacyl-ACP synthase III [unclassified Ruminococcus]MCQ4022005.1 beta-ketoacyl-ACP synthase III [Ruminococcus sp. zg-924]MCQ4114541.1 beta-ketoacyl-ACP synthase III [Ruminococcus sp. zg-921]